MSIRKYTSVSLTEKKAVIDQIVPLIENGAKWSEIERKLNIKRQTLQNWYKQRAAIHTHISLNPTSQSTVRIYAFFKIIK